MELSDSEIKAMRVEFEKYVGMKPEVWLKRHRAGEREGVFDNSSKNLWIHYRALFLEIEDGFYMTVTDEVEIELWVDGELVEPVGGWYGATK